MLHNWLARGTQTQVNEGHKPKSMTNAFQRELFCQIPGWRDKTETGIETALILLVQYWMQVHGHPGKAARCLSLCKGLSLDCSSINSPSNYHQMIRCDSYHLNNFICKKPKAPILELYPQAHISDKGKRNSNPGHLILSQKCLSTATGHLPNRLCKFNHCLPTLATPASELINFLCISSRGGGGDE